MKIYTALLKTDAEPVLVPEGFAWGAAIFGPFWLAAHRAWVAAAISLAVYVLISLGPRPAVTILTAGVAAILGFTGRDLHRWALEHRGYRLVHVLMAKNPDEAFVRLLINRPDLTSRFRPKRV